MSNITPEIKEEVTYTFSADAIRQIIQAYVKEKHNADVELSKIDFGIGTAPSSGGYYDQRESPTYILKQATAKVIK